MSLSMQRSQSCTSQWCSCMRTCLTFHQAADPSQVEPRPLVVLPRWEPRPWHTLLCWQALLCYRLLTQVTGMRHALAEAKCTKGSRGAQTHHPQTQRNHQSARHERQGVEHPCMTVAHAHPFSGTGTCGQGKGGGVSSPVTFQQRLQGTNICQAVPHQQPRWQRHSIQPCGI